VAGAGLATWMRFQNCQPLQAMPFMTARLADERLEDS